MNKFLKIEKLTKEIGKYKSIIKCHCTHTKKKKKGREREIKKRRKGRREEKRKYKKQAKVQMASWLNSITISRKEMPIL